MIDLLYEDAMILYQTGNYSLAEKKLQKILIEAPFEANAHFAYAASLQMQKKYLQAINAWNQALLLDTTNSEAYLHLAECLISVDKKRDAKDMLQLAKSYAPEKLQSKIDQLVKSLSEEHYHGN